MHDLEGVKEPNANYDLLRDLGCIVLAKYLFFLDKLEEILAVDQLSYDVNVSLSLDALFEL